MYAGKLEDLFTSTHRPGREHRTRPGPKVQKAETYLTKHIYTQNKKQKFPVTGPRTDQKKTQNKTELRWLTQEVRGYPDNIQEAGDKGEDEVLEADHNRFADPEVGNERSEDPEVTDGARHSRNKTQPGADVELADD
ncbi:hypothetical protein ILYODFUR_016283 [Ilyodon furcidens]|uniref:Uncharacterized protein n=1 Tax=Ilyodon furcidens TaxID=33524 RepID=A0ABV0T8N6_9TELE